MSDNILDEVSDIHDEFVTIVNSIALIKTNLTDLQNSLCVI